MADRIHQLPDPIANQIAAGEVIQRPASAAKELLENAVDAGATAVQLVVRDAGKELVQVIDNGCGMSPADARMAFARHATSKISGIEDLFHIRSMGFRGEALASIAAVAEVTLKTRTSEQELGTCLELAQSKVLSEEACACPQGTSIAMRNLFFNVPARRHFLKSNATELRHIVDEFLRVALGFPAVSFTLQANGQEIYHLPAAGLKQRLVQVLGQAYASRLVTIEENTEYLQVSGFVGKPEAAKKTRGDQYLFVNSRFIRSAYLHHAVMNAFEDLLPPDSHPMYALYIALDPRHVDINVHPTKQEIKFEDEKLLYAFIQSAVKHALVRFSVTPALDFGLDPDIQQLPAVSRPISEADRAALPATDIYRSFTRSHQAHVLGGGRWKDLYPRPEAGGALPPMPAGEEEEPATAPGLWKEEEGGQKEPFQLQGRYIVQQIRAGFILVDQQAAHERILYERFRRLSAQQPASTQQSLFPQTISMSAADALLLEEMLPELQPLGYDIRPFGPQAFVIQGVPADLEAGGEGGIIEELLEQYKHVQGEPRLDRREKTIRALARQQAVKPGKALGAAQMQHLIDLLFACAEPQTAPSGGKTFLTFRGEDLDRMFGR